MVKVSLADFMQWDHALRAAYLFTNPFRIAAALSLGLRPPCEDEAPIILSMYEKLLSECANDRAETAVSLAGMATSNYCCGVRLDVML